MYPVSEEKLELYNLLTGVEYYWRVKEAAQNGVTSETGSFFIKADGPRNLFIEGVTNVRDLGGYSASNKIKQGLSTAAGGSTTVIPKDSARKTTLGTNIALWSRKSRLPAQRFLQKFSA